ncbi:protein of unknown function [Caballeronia sp. S22]
MSYEAPPALRLPALAQSSLIEPRNPEQRANNKLEYTRKRAATGLE